MQRKFIQNWRVQFFIFLCVAITFVVALYSVRFLSTSAEVASGKGYVFGSARRHIKSGGQGPRATYTNDFNIDSKSDIAVANYYDGNLAILISNGDGTFQDPVTYTVGTNPVDIYVADLNGDNRGDFIVANNGSANVSVLLGNSNGTAQAAVNYSVGTNPNSVWSEDFNGDSKKDLAVANAGSANVSVLLGNGDGTFQAAVNYSVTGSPSAVVSADLNADAKNDLAVANTSQVAVLLGNGDGTFQTASYYTAGSGPSAILVEDFNGDSKKELVVANKTGSNISVLLNNGDGTFPSYVNYGSTSAQPTSILAVDLNKDSRKDIVTANSTSNSVSVFLGNGDATFQTPNTFAVSWNAYGSLSAADFNGDSNIDMVVPHKGTDNGNYPSFAIGILFGYGDGTFQVSSEYATGTFPIWVSGDDFNKDGKQDLVTANGTSNNVSVLLGNGDSTFQDAANYSVGPQPFMPVAGDFNNDGKLDLAVSNRGDNTISVLLGNGDGTFQTGVNYTARAKPFQMTTADFNGDSKLDIAGGSSLFLGNGDGTFQAAVAASGSFSAYVNGDNFTDLINVGGSGGSVLLGNGNGTFQGAINFTSGGSDVRGVTVGDINKDGKNDMVVNNYASDTVSVFLGNGDGTFASPANYETGDAPQQPALLDFNNDGKLDIVNANWYGRDVSFLVGNGDGTFQKPVFLGISQGASGGPGNVHAADFNNDGRKDLAINNTGSNTVSVLMAANLKITESGTDTSVTEGRTSDTYTAVLTTKPTANVTIQIAGDAQVQVSPYSLTFTPSNWSSPQTVTVVAINDNATEGNHTGVVSHTLSTLDAVYSNVSLGTLTVKVSEVIASTASSGSGGAPVTIGTSTGTSTVGTSTVGTSTVGTTTVGTTTEEQTSTPAGPWQFEDVLRTGTSTLNINVVKAIYEINQKMVDANILSEPPDTFGPFNKTTRYFAIQLALLVAGKNCGEVVSFDTCNDAAIKAGLIDSEAQPDLFITREQFYTLMVKAAGLTVVSKTSSKFKKNMTFKDVSATSSVAPVLATARLYGIAAFYRGNKCNCKLAFPKYSAVIFAVRTLVAKKKK